MAVTGQIQVRCPKCNKAMLNDRNPDDPRQAMEVVIICPSCDDGDFHTPSYFSASGREIDWETGRPFD